MWWYWSEVVSSPDPRPHPLTTRTGLVNQVEFLGLMRTLVTVTWNILHQTRSKMVRVPMKRFTVVKEMLCNNFWSCNLIGLYYFLGVKHKKFWLCLPDHSLTKRHTWAGNETISEVQNLWRLVYSQWVNSNREWELAHFEIVLLYSIQQNNSCVYFWSCS